MTFKAGVQEADRFPLSVQSFKRQILPPLVIYRLLKRQQVSFQSLAFIFQLSTDIHAPTVAKAESTGTQGQPNRHQGCTSSH